MSTNTPSSRPRPVLIYAAVMAGLTALTGYAGLDQLVPAAAVSWLALLTVVAGAIGGVLVQGQVTPVSDPRDRYGRRLVAPSPGGHLSGDVGPGR
jgi:hypothetical protein